jgi:hypothetical protein
MEGSRQCRGIDIPVRLTQIMENNLQSICVVCLALIRLLAAQHKLNDLHSVLELVCGLPSLNSLESGEGGIAVRLRRNRKSVFWIEC